MADIWCWNVNGINALIEKGHFRQFLRWANPTILCLNETKTSLEKVDEKFLYTHIPPGYAQYWNCSSARKGYSGTAIFSKVAPREVQYDFGEKHVSEGRTITAEFE